MTKLGTLCPICGADGMQWKEVKTYHYRQSGLDNVWLHGGVRKARCPACGEELIHIEDEWQLLQVIALALLHRPSLLTGPETRFLREAAGLTQMELASLLRVRRQATISDRERKNEPVMTYPEDLGFRLLILQEFAAFLKRNPKESLLADEHWAILARLAGFLSEKANALIRGRAQKRRVEVQRSKTTRKADLPRAA